MPADVMTSDLQGSDETPVIIILVVCIVGVFILTLNVGLILFFIRKRKKRLEGKCCYRAGSNGLCTTLKFSLINVETCTVSVRGKHKNGKDALIYDCYTH